MSVVEADFSAQLIHVADEDDAPLCGSDPEGAFVADSDKPLKEGMRWCGACRRKEQGR